MKKLSIFLLAVLLTVSLFVSCDNTTKAVTDEHVAVTFSTGADSRSLSYAIEDVSNLQWFYTAKKANQSDSFKYGQTDDNGKPFTLGSEIEFSQGLWNFVLWAEKGAVVTAEGSVTSHGTKVYQGRPEGSVLIKRQANPQNISINVSPVIAGVNGSIKFDGIYIALKGDSETKTVYPSTALIVDKDEQTQTISLVNGSSDGVISLTPGDYRVTVKHTETFGTDTVEYASETLFVTVWSGRETTIQGNITELTGSAIIDGNIQIPTIAAISKTATAGQETIFKASVAPVNNLQSTKMESTTVSFAANSLVQSGTETDVSLTVSVKDIETAGNDSTFIIEENQSAIAGISLNLTVDGENKTGLFGDAVITTYIVKGLKSVNVKYNGTNYTTQPGEIEVITSTQTPTDNTKYYESDTGKLVFSTDHFSEYYVVSNSVVALNVTTNTAYSSLGDAIDDAKNNSTISLLADVETPNKSYYVADKNLTLNLNGKTLSGSGDDGTLCVKSTATLTINGEGKVIGNDDNGYGMAIWANGLNSNVIINGGTYSNTLTHDDDQMDLIYASKGGKVEIYGGEFNCITPKWTLNVRDADYSSGASSFTVYGGKFKDYDPSNSATEYPNANFVVTGKTAIKEEDSYFVVTELENFASTQDEFLTYINNFKASSETKMTINLGSGEFSVPTDCEQQEKPLSGKELTISGSNQTILKASTTYYFNNADLVLNNLTLKNPKGDTNYQGFCHLKNGNFNNCTILNRYDYYGDNSASFDQCEFITEDYSLWTYSAKNYSFNKCKFTGNGGKFINAYMVLPMDSPYEISISDCEFIVGESASNYKPAVCLKGYNNDSIAGPSSNHGWILEISNTTFNTNGKTKKLLGSYSSLIESGSDLYAVEGLPANPTEYVKGSYMVSIDRTTVLNIRDGIAITD